MTRQTKSLAILAALSGAIAPACGTTNTTPSPVTSVEVRPSTSQLVVGQTLQLQVVLRDGSGNVVSGRLVTYSSSVPSVATVDAEGLVAATGSGSTVITASSEGASGASGVDVRGQAIIELDQDEVDFEATRDAQDPAPETVDITNGGEAALVNLVASVDYLGGVGGWLTTTLSSTSAPSRMTLTASVRDLATGVYTARVDVSSLSAANSPQSVLVTFDVLEPPPVIALSTSQVELDAPEGSLTPVPANVAVTNAGGDVLDGLEVDVEYAAGQPEGWLTATLGATVAPTNVILAATANPLPPGTYQATVEVSAPDAVNSPQSLTVLFTVVPRTGVGAEGGASGAGGSR